MSQQEAVSASLFRPPRGQGIIEISDADYRSAATPCDPLEEVTVVKNSRAGKKIMGSPRDRKKQA